MCENSVQCTQLIHLPCINRSIENEYRAGFFGTVEYWCAFFLYYTLVFAAIVQDVRVIRILASLLNNKNDDKIIAPHLYHHIGMPFNSLRWLFDCNFYLQFFHTFYSKFSSAKCVYFLRNRRDCTGFHLWIKATKKNIWIKSVEEWASKVHIKRAANQSERFIAFYTHTETQTHSTDIFGYFQSNPLTLWIICSHCEDNREHRCIYMLRLVLLNKLQ